MSGRLWETLQLRKRSGHLLGAYILWGESNVPLSEKGKVPSHHFGHHFEAVVAGMRTFKVPEGFLVAQKWPPSYCLPSHASHLWSDGGLEFDPKGFQSTEPGVDWHTVPSHSDNSGAQWESSQCYTNHNHSELLSLDFDCLRLRFTATLIFLGILVHFSAILIITLYLATYI